MPVPFRFYSVRSTTPDISPAIEAGWGAGTLQDRQILTLDRSHPNGLDFSNWTQNSSGVANQDCINQQMISEFFLAPQIIGGAGWTFEARLRASEAAAGIDARAQIVVKIVSRDGTVVRGILVDFDVAALANEFVVTTLTNRAFPRGAPVAMNAVECRAGDRIVVEEGWRNHGTTVGVVRINYGPSADAADLPSDETTTAVGRHWFEINNDVRLYVPRRMFTDHGGVGVV